MKVLKICFKRILVILMIFVTLMFFLANAGTGVQAKSKLPAEGEFYYAGTTKGTYTVTQGIFDWLLENLSGIVDWILGITTMIFRMVFVGWTVLIERLLTWVLESSMNMNMEIGDINSTDVSSNSDSSKNVTVESIVFGLVPMFDINIFDVSLAENITGTGIDLSRYVCEKCNLGIDECTCNTTADNKCSCNLCELKAYYEGSVETSLEGIKDMTCTKCSKKIIDCTCTDCDCDACEAKKENRKNAVLMVKEAVAEWYYVIRLIAIVVMLLVLLGIGIKMATSSIASDKALYKRMLVDWVVGMIILFTIHYAMIAIISINDSLVAVIREASISSVKDNQNVTEIEGSPSFNETVKTNAGIEISLYEEVRTRAYDPKLINGMTGMVLYMTLVYFAVRFSLIYLKRYLTIIVLTLMAPGVGVAYAIQKALTGKSSSFSTWLTEYIMNTIIQVVHALLYAAFVSMALKLALNSVAGMILAFVVMNYMLKAEKLFRKIFKMSSNGSLLDHTEEAGNMEKLAKTAQGAYFAAKPVATAMMKSPITQAALGGVKAIGAGAILGGSLIKKGMDDIKENKLQNEMKNQSEDYKKLSENKDSEEYKNFTKTEDYQALREKAFLKLNTNTKKKKAQMDTFMRGMEQGGFEQEEEAALKAAMYTDERPLKEGETEEERQQESIKRWANYAKIHGDNKTFKKLTNQTTLGIATAHVGKLLDYNNYFIPHEKNGEKKVNPFKDRRKGKWVWDEKKKRPVHISQIGDALKNQLSVEELLGFTEADKKQAREVSKFVGKGLLGIGAMYAGLGTFVAHPGIGMPLIAAGVAQTTEMTRKNKKRVRPNMRLKKNNVLQNTHVNIKEEMEEDLKEERFRLARYNSGSMITMQSQLMQAVEQEQRKITQEHFEKVKEKHPEFAEALEKGEVTATGRYELPEISNEDLEAISERFESVVYKRTNRPIVDSMFGGIAERMDQVSLDHFKQIEKQKKKEKQVAIAMISDALQDEFMQKYQELEKTLQNEPETISTSPAENTKKKSKEQPIGILSKTKADIKDAKAIKDIIEVAILEEARTTKKDIRDVDIKKGDVQNNIRKTMESILKEKNGIEAGQKVEDVIKNLDKEIIEAKDRLDKEKTKVVTKKKESLKDILRAAAAETVTKEEGKQEGEKEFIERLTGFDVDASDEVNQKTLDLKKLNPEKKSESNLTKKQTDKVVELLLLQKQMRELNVEAKKLKMKPDEANRHYEEARTFVLDKNKDKGVKELGTPTDKNYYGPITNIIDLINNM